MMLSQQQRQGILFQTPLKSQDDFCIKYDMFKDDGENGETDHNIDGVNSIFIFNTVIIFSSRFMPSQKNLFIL